MGGKITTVPVAGRKQSDGDISIAYFPSDVEWIQIDAECSLVPTGGSLAVKFKTPGMTTAKALLSSGVPVVISLKNPYPVLIENICLSEIILSPSGFDADKTFSVCVSWEDE